MNSKQRQIKLMSKEVAYTLTYKPVRNINMRIKKDGLFVSAPIGTSIHFIENALKSRENEIIKHIDKISSYHTTEPFSDGKMLLFLGNNYILHIIVSNKNDVVIKDNNIIVYTKNMNAAQSVYEKWLKEKAKTIFSNSLERIYPLLNDQIKEKPNIHVKKLTASWGRCMPYKNNISLSVWLIKANISLIDYVILHELCHYVHLNHSKEFYALLGSLMPDYKNRKKLLNTIQIGT